MLKWSSTLTSGFGVRCSVLAYLMSNAEVELAPQVGAQFTSFPEDPDSCAKSYMQTAKEGSSYLKAQTISAFQLPPNPILHLRQF
jgi:hypothetical protein